MPTGEEIVALAETRLGEQYIFGAQVPKDDPSWNGPWDCAEFASWCVYQATGQLYGCNSNTAAPGSADAYTGYWARDAAAIGTRVTVDEAACTPGAMVLRVPQGKVTGHIVISDGNGGTVEAHSSTHGVIRSTLSNRRWDCGILVPAVDYTAQGPAAVVSPSSTVFRVTSPLMQGSQVTAIQNALIANGFNPGGADGIYGQRTAAAVHAFQLAKGLVPDGEVGPITAAALGI